MIVSSCVRRLCVCVFVCFFPSCLYVWLCVMCVVCVVCVCVSVDLFACVYDCLYDYLNVSVFMLSSMIGYLR